MSVAFSALTGVIFDDAYLYDGTRTSPQSEVDAALAGAPHQHHCDRDGISSDATCSYDNRFYLASAAARRGGCGYAPQTARTAVASSDDAVSLFRAVSQAGADDIARHGFRAHPGGRSMETKLLTTSPENAVQIGRQLYRGPGEFFHVARVDVPRSFVDELYRFTDAGLPSVSVYPEQFGALNRLGQRSTLDALPWWPKP